MVHLCPIEKSSKTDTIKEKKSSKDISISRNKFVGYSLNPDKAPDKARAFELALGYTKDNCDKLIEDVERNADVNKIVEKGDKGHGMRYEQVMRLKGPNDKEANVLTAWIDRDDKIDMTSVYVTKKEEAK